MDRTDDDERRALALLDLAFEQEPDDPHAFVRAQSDIPEYVRQRALQLLEADQATHDVIATGEGLVAAAAFANPPERLGPWQVGDMIGRGGMGAVFLGRRVDGDFDQTVAIKLVEGQAAKPRLADRLREERRLLAPLSHPHIAQLIDGGETEGGEPYLVAEYVPGQTLRELKGTRDLSLDERLRIVCDVASGIAYAHRYGIIHRDLSPSNILVRDDGVVKIIDFGIAKSVEDTEDPGQRRSITKGFTAPERVSGGATTTLVDIYSLGAVLGWLTEGVSAPRAEDLAAIIAKATAELASERYDSADQLKVDIERYLARQAVAAGPATFGYRMTRFAGRHPLSLISASLAVLGVIAAWLVTTALYWRAEQAETEAVARFDALRDLARTVLFDIYTDIERIPLTEDAQLRISELGKTYLEQLEQDPRATDDLSQDVAEGYVQLGHIVADSNKDFFFDPEAATSYWEEADRRLDRILATHPNDPDALKAKAQLQRWRIQSTFFAESDREGTIDALGEADGLVGAVLEANPADSEAMLIRTALRSALADALARSGRPEEAEVLLETTLSEASAFSPAQDDARDFYLAKANLRRMLARIVTRQGDHARAINVLSESLTDLDAAEAITPEDAFTRRARSIAHWRRAYARNVSGDPEGAIVDYQQAVAITERRLTIDPESDDAQYNLVAWSAEMSLPLGALERYAEAEAALETSGAWYTARFNETPEDPRRQRTMLVHSAQMTELYRSWQKDDERCAATTDLVRFADLMVASGAMSEEDAGAIAPYRTQLEACED